MDCHDALKVAEVNGEITGETQRVTLAAKGETDSDLEDHGEGTLFGIGLRRLSLPLWASRGRIPCANLRSGMGYGNWSN